MKLTLRFVHVLPVCVLLALIHARSFATPAQVEALGFSPSRLERLDNVIQSTVDQHQLSGAVMYLARDGQTVELKAYGLQDIENKKPMQTDTIFRIASMSKAVTTVAALILYEEGRFMLSDPVSKYIPAFAHSVVAVPPPVGSAPDIKYTTVPVQHPITIHDLMRHTSGLTYGDGLAVDDYKKANLYGWYFANHDETIGAAIDRLATLPLNAQPGEKWQYGYSTDVLGRLVEVISGLPLDRFVEERITRPLKMVDTSFFLPPGKESRLANVYGLEKGQLLLEESVEKSDYVHGPRKCFSGGAGLLSTIGDYGRLLQMLLNDGELDGVRILSPKIVQLMHENHTGDKYDRDTHAFGLGFWVNNDPGFYGELVSKGAYGWGSAYYPQYLVDPQEKIVAIFMTQLTPTDGLDLNQRFKVLTYQALVKPRAKK
ncbi:MAG TPA: serine hydrolase domain-containing protein [Lacunisphaera sp.]|jgi:CubicO group peptidase (beta-lactamase class C family)